METDNATLAVHGRTKLWGGITCRSRPPMRLVSQRERLRARRTAPR